MLEILRRNNIAPLGIAHRVTRNTDLYGYTIPEGTMVLTNLFSVHMDPNHWNEPYDFKPERFLKDGSINFDENHYFPFGIGI